VIRSPVFLAQPDAGFVPSLVRRLVGTASPGPGAHPRTRVFDSVCGRGLLSPRWGWGFLSGGHPRLTPWAAFFRRFAAAAQSGFSAACQPHFAWDNFVAANSSAFCSASAAFTFTSGSTPVPSQFVLVMGFTARAKGTPIMK